VWRSIQRRGEGLSADPMAVVLGRSAALAVIAGVGLFFLNQERSPNPTVTSIKGAPYVLPLAIGLMIFWTFILTKTRFGRYVYATGGNAEAARRAGVDLRRIRVAAFTIGSGMAALGGVVQASRLGAIPTDAGGGNTLLYAVAAAVIGGTSLFGGRGRVRDAVIGGLVIAMIPNGLGLLPNLPSSANFIITALVLLLAASVDALSRKRSTTS
jgi:D-xylose transport system permease protein